MAISFFRFGGAGLDAQCCDLLVSVGEASPKDLRVLKVLKVVKVFKDFKTVGKDFALSCKKKTPSAYYADGG